MKISHHVKYYIFPAGKVVASGWEASWVMSRLGLDEFWNNQDGV